MNSNTKLPTAAFKPLVYPAIFAIAFGTALAVTDDFESGLGQWQAGGTWGLTSARHASPTHAVTDSPGAFYSNNSNSSLTLAAAVNLSAVTRAALGFRHSHELESGYDFGRVEVSTDGGATWQASPLASYICILHRAAWE